MLRCLLLRYEVELGGMVMSLLMITCFRLQEGFSRFSWAQSNKRTPLGPPCLAVRLSNTNGDQPFQCLSLDVSDAIHQINIISIIVHRA